MTARKNRYSTKTYSSHRFLEALEQRTLLTITGIATPDFIIQRNHTFLPSATLSPLGIPAPSGISPSVMRQAYQINQALFGSVAGDGSGQTIAIVDAYNAPTITSDLHIFDQQFGLIDPVLTVINQSGGSNLPGTDPSGPGNSWAVETSLDVEWAHAVAPGAKILLVEANSASNSDLMAAVNTARHYAGVSVVSMSWGGDESTADSINNSTFTTPAGHNGVTFVASSGDSGSYGSFGTRAVSYPAASANVLSVGGTRLSVDFSGNYLSESGWGNGTNSYFSGGSGGGISRYQTQPTYQHGIVTQTSTFRALPDVAMDADPNSGVAVIDTWDSPGSPWNVVGGTSLAAPMWAGVIAIANQGRVLAGKTTLDGPSQTLPMIYAAPSSDFHDITTGNNGFAAGTGFDLVTGRGTPIVNRLVADLSGSSTSNTPTIGSFSTGVTTVVAGNSITLTALNVTETNGTISSVKFYRESNGSAGLQVGTDTLVGTGTKNGTTWTISASTTGFTPGSYTYYAVATDSTNVSSAASSASVNVTQPVSGNDNFASATVLSGTTLNVTGSSVNTTKQSGEPAHAGNTGGHSVWWTWTATASGKVSLNTHGSSFDTLLGVYTGTSVSALTPVASNDDTSYFDLTSSLTFNAVAGTTYKIAVDGYNGASGSIELNLVESVPPANNNFAGALKITGTSPWTGTNVGATRETGEPTIAGNSGGTSIWYSWTAPTSGSVSFNTHGSSFDTMLGVYTGTSVGALTTLASNDDTSSLDRTSALSFNAVAGQTYYIRVDGYNAATGNVVLNIV